MALPTPQFADIPGAVNRGLQFRQQQELAPLQQQSAQLGIQNQQQQFKTGGLQQQNIQGQIDKRSDEQKNISLVNTALKVGTLGDEEIAPFLKSQIAFIKSEGGDPAESERALALAESGDFATVRKGAKNLVDIGVRQGIIKPEAQQQQAKGTKPTSSQQDFETFKELNAKAVATNDPVDIQLAKQFGVQSGFDRLSPQELADVDVEKQSKITLGKQAAVASKEAFTSLKKIRTTIANMDDAIKAIDKGAATGPIVSKLPSFREASIELGNIKGRMGLDVIGSTTFGALSESELEFALNTALPESLEPAALKKWLKDKKVVHKKLADELRSAASFLGKPGNTISGYLEHQEKKNPSVDNLSDEDLFK